MKRRFAGLLLLAGLFLLSACGLKGPLYLEKAPQSKATISEIEKTPAMKETDGEDKEDKDKSEKKD